MNDDGELTADVALERLRPLLNVVSETEHVALAEARGRVLAKDLVSPIDLPPFDSAAMDGFAVRSSASTVATIVGEARAGHPYAGALAANQAVRIMTGAPLPSGADAVVMLEHAEVGGTTMRPTLSAAPGMNVRLQGEHVRRLATVLKAGRRLGSADLGLAASIGTEHVEVKRRLRIGVLSTGDELVEAPAELAAGAIYDGNRPLLIGLVEHAGHCAIDFGIAADTAAALKQRIAGAIEQRVDVLITTGGASLGDADVVRQHPALRFISVDFRPGRGVVAGLLSPAEAAPLLLGLPGNAVAAYVMYQLIAAPLLAHASGNGREQRLRLRLPLATSARGKTRTEWRRARFVTHAGATAVEPLAEQGSAMLGTLARADALVAIEARADLAAGALVEVIPTAPAG